jgi:hypothetical protein
MFCLVILQDCQTRWQNVETFDASMKYAALKKDRISFVLGKGC